MSNIQFMWNNLLDQATLTASSEDSDFPASNLQNPFRTKVWTTAGTTPGTANLVIDHGAATAVTAVVLINYSWSVAPGTLNLEFNATDAWGAPSATESLTWADTPDTYGNPCAIIKTFASKSYRYNRLNVVNAAGDWDLGRMYIGTYFEPTRDYNYQYAEEIPDPAMMSSSVGGQDHADEIEKYRQRKFGFKPTTYSQYRLFQQVYNTVGITKDLFIAFDPTNYANELTMYGKLTEFRHSKDVVWSIDMGFKESR